MKKDKSGNGSNIIMTVLRRGIGKTPANLDSGNERLREISLSFFSLSSSALFFLFPSRSRGRDEISAKGSGGGGTSLPYPPPPPKREQKKKMRRRKQMKRERNESFCVYGGRRRCAAMRCGAVPKSCRGRRIEPHFPFYPTPHPRVFSICLRNGRKGRGGKKIRTGTFHVERER